MWGIMHGQMALGWHNSCMEGIVKLIKDMGACVIVLNIASDNLRFVGR